MRSVITAFAIATFVLALVTSCSSGSGGGSSSGLTTYDPVTISPITGITSDFIRGVDASMVRQIELKGGAFYDEDNTKTDALTIFADHGVNWIRLRIWNSHKDSSGNWLGGGNNDLTKTKAIAIRAKALGMKVLLDFHYSDTWADPNSQTRPAAWASLASDETADDALEQAVYTYTYNTVQSLADAGAAPDMVQIGNEINSGMLWEGSSADNTDIELGQLLNQAATAVKAVDSTILVMIHIARYNWSDILWWFGRYATHSGTAPTSGIEVNFDVIGLSYYPYWHRALTNLGTNIANIQSVFGKDAVVAETAYGWTLDWADSTDNIFYTTQETAAATYMGYTSAAASIQMQANVVRDIMATVSDNGGLGVFYWGGDWIPVTGAGFGYDADGSYYEGDTWENQALFDFDGKALPSLNVFSVTG